MAGDTRVGKLVVEIVGDTSGLISAYDEASKQTTGFEGKLRNISSTLSGIGAELSLKVTAPLALAGGIALKTAVDFDDSMRKVAAVTGATGEQFDALRQQALDLGSATAFSSSQAASAMQYLGMAGLSTNEILEATPQMLSLASAGTMDLGTAADISTNVLSGFNLQVKDLAHVSDILAQAAASSNTSVEQLGTAMAYAAPVASAAGLSIEETTAAIQVMSNSGIQGSMAGTALRGALTSLLSPTKQATDVLASYGLTADDVNPQIHSLAEIIDTLNGVGISAGDTMTLFGDRAGSGMTKLLEAGRGGIEKYSDALKDCDGAAARMAETMESGPGAKLRELEGAVERANIAFGDLIAEALTPAMDGARDLANWLSSLDEGTQKVIITTGLFAASIGPATWAVGTLAGGVSNMITLHRTYQASTLAATIATKGLTAAIAANPVGLAIIGLTTLGAVLLPLIMSTRDATEATDDYNAALGKTPDLTNLTTEAIDEEIKRLEESIRLKREAASLLRGEAGPATRAAAADTRTAANATAGLTQANDDLVLSFHDSLRATNQQGSAVDRLSKKEKILQADLLDEQIANDDAALAAYRHEKATRALADGAETAYKQASKAVSSHQKAVSDLQKEYDALKTTINEALGIDEEITDAGRDVERAEIRKIRAKQDLSDLDKEIADKERELQTTEYGSIDEREAAERELADLRLRQREAVLDVADAEDAYTDTLEKQAETQRKKTELEGQLNGESIASAQTRLDEIGKAIDEETEKLDGALKARETAQANHEILMNQLNNDALETKSENWKTYVEYVASNPAMAATVHVEYDSDGNMIGSVPTITVPDIQTPTYADLASAADSALGRAIANGTYNYGHNARGADDRALGGGQTPQTPSSPPGVVIENLNVVSPKADAPTIAFETTRALRTLGSRGAGL